MSVQINKRKTECFPHLELKQLINWKTNTAYSCSKNNFTQVVLVLTAMVWLHGSFNSYWLPILRRGLIDEKLNVIFFFILILYLRQIPCFHSFINFSC